MPLIDAFLGLAWAASLRGYMAELAGPQSHVDWVGTFVLILLPGAVVGALFGWAESSRRRGLRRTWVAFTPLLFPILALAPPGALVRFLATGIGGGSLALVLTVAALSGPAIRPELTLTEPRGAWVAILAVTTTSLFAWACAIPHRAPLAN